MRSFPPFASAVKPKTTFVTLHAACVSRQCPAVATRSGPTRNAVHATPERWFRKRSFGQRGRKVPPPTSPCVSGLVAERAARRRASHAAVLNQRGGGVGPADEPRIRERSELDAVILAEHDWLFELAEGLLLRGPWRCAPESEREHEPLRSPWRKASTPEHSSSEHVHVLQRSAPPTLLDWSPTEPEPSLEKRAAPRR